MDPQDVIAMAAEDALKRKRQKKRQMEESLRAVQFALQEKKTERSMLKRIKQGMLLKEAPKKKLVDEYAVFFLAPKSNDLENAQKFDEKAMMNAISNTMNSDCSEHGGFAGGYGDSNTVPGNVPGLVEQAMTSAAEALLNSVGTSVGDNGGFAGSHGGINNAAKNANNLGNGSKEGVMTPTEGTSSDGSEGSNAGGHDGGNRRN